MYIHARLSPRCVGRTRTCPVEPRSNGGAKSASRRSSATYSDMVSVAVCENGTAQRSPTVFWINFLVRHADWVRGHQHVERSTTAPVVATGHHLQSFTVYEERVAILYTVNSIAADMNDLRDTPHDGCSRAPSQHVVRGH